MTFFSEQNVEGANYAEDNGVLSEVAGEVWILFDNEIIIQIKTKLTNKKLNKQNQADVDKRLPTKEDIFGRQVTALTLQYQEDNEKILSQLEDNKVRADSLISVFSQTFTGQTGTQTAGSDSCQEIEKSKEVLRKGF